MKRHRKPCPYCARGMEPGHPRLAPSWDHVIPKSKGGRMKIICCVECNNIKGNMMPDDWAAYMWQVPMWWTLTPKERRAIAQGDQESIRTAKWGPRRRQRQGSPPPGPVVVPPELIWPD